MNVSVSTGPSFSYCVTAVEADRAIDAVIADADGGPIALDIESAAATEEAERLKSIHRKLALSQADLTLLKKQGEDGPIQSKKAEIAVLKAQAAFAETAALDPHRASIRLVQLYGGGKRVAVIDLFR